MDGWMGSFVPDYRIDRCMIGDPWHSHEFGRGRQTVRCRPQIAATQIARKVDKGQWRIDVYVHAYVYEPCTGDLYGM